MFKSDLEFLTALGEARSPAAIREVLRLIGDSPAVTLDQRFGPLGLEWHPFGDDPSNISTVGLGTKPGRSLTERLTNAIDAILEDRASPNLPMPRSPRLAARQWFGRPVSGPDDGLFNWQYGEDGMDRRVAVVMTSSGIESAPTIDVIDQGIGLTPQECPTTILSLHQGNKIKKWYLIGAFGQGGASTLAFCEYAVIVSRSHRNPSTVAFTVIKVLKLGEEYKEDTFAYLCRRNERGEVVTPSCETSAAPLRLYSGPDNPALPTLAHGTLVRHVGYRLTNLAGKLGPSPGNLYHYLHASLFDPLFPFRLIDLRDEDAGRDELVRGSRNRLMRLVRDSEKGGDTEGSGSELKHHRPMEFITPHGGQESSIGIEYWVVFNYRKGRGEKRDDLILRPNSSEIYVQTGHPVLGTLNGQNQGELTAQLLREAGLSMVSRHIVIHIDTSESNSKVRRELFSTSREGFKDGPILEDLKRVLKQMLEEDATLQALEKELTEKLARREAASASEEVRKQVTRLLLDAGLQIKDPGEADEPGEGNEKRKIRKPRTGKPLKFDPLPTLPFPEVTRFEIMVPTEKLDIAINDLEVVLVETDADAEFDRRSLLAIRTEPNLLEVIAKGPLRGGRARWRLRPREGVAAGTTGLVIVTLTMPDGRQLRDEVPFEVQPAVEEKAKKVKGTVPPFDIIPIDPEGSPAEWGNTWPDLDEEEDFEKLSEVAYRPIRMGGGINVYYSTIFGPFREEIERLKNTSPALMDLFRSNYETWIAYHAILQDRGRGVSLEGVNDEAVEELLERDRTRVARMQARQALRMADLMRQVSRAAVPEE